MNQILDGKIIDGKYCKLIEGKPVMFDMPDFKTWCKISSLPQDKLSRQIYNHDKKTRPTILKAINHLMNEEVGLAVEELLKICNVTNGGWCI